MAERRLFDGVDDIEVFTKVKYAEVPPLGELRAGLPPELIAAVHKALAVDPAARFSSAREFALELSILLGGAKNSHGAQQLLGRAVNEVRRWRNEEALLRADEPSIAPGSSSFAETKRSWDAVEVGEGCEIIEFIWKLPLPSFR